MNLEYLKDRPTLQKVLATLLTALVALGGILLWGGDEESDQRAVAQVCDVLEMLENPDIAETCEIFTHGPDPRSAALEAPAVVAAEGVLHPVPPEKLCVSGPTGHRVHVFTAPGASKDAAWDTLGYAQKYLNLSSTTHRQRIRFLCSGGRPRIDEISIPWGSSGHFSTFWRTLDEMGHNLPNRLYLFLGEPPSYPYCGQGSVGVWGYHEEGQPPDYRVAPEAQYSIVRCQGASRTTLHEIGHNLGAVVPEAPHSSGAWHCWDSSDIMCYDDGGPYFQAGGEEQAFCQTKRMTSKDGVALIRGSFDCQKDDYWNPSGLGSLVYNTAESRFLTRPREI